MGSLGVLIHVHVINPVARDTTIDKNLGHLEEYGVKVTQSQLTRGPESIESRFDEALCLPGVIQNGLAAQQAGAHAVVVSCMADPGVEALREKLDIPVLGPGQTSFHLAAQLGKHFSILSPLEHLTTLFEDQLNLYGLGGGKLASVRAIDVPVTDLDLDDASGTFRRLVDASIAAVKQDGADTLILGCTGMKTMAQRLSMALMDHGVNVPVVDPMPATVLQAATCVRLQLSHSKIAYQHPPEKKIVGFEHLFVK